MFELIGGSAATSASGERRGTAPSSATIACEGVNRLGVPSGSNDRKG